MVSTTLWKRRHKLLTPEPITPVPQPIRQPPQEPDDEIAPVHRTYTSIASVGYSDGLWRTYSGNGALLGVFNREVDAWALAEKVGMVRES